MRNQDLARLKSLDPPRSKCCCADCPCKSEDAITVQLDVKDYE